MAPLETGPNPIGEVALMTGASRLRAIGPAIFGALAARGGHVAFSHLRPYDASFP